jgi:hypothetical protein
VLGEPVPSEEEVFRLSFLSSDGKISPEAFELSSADKQQTPPRLSVFARSRTTPAQAWEITSRNPRFISVARLATSRLRQIALEVRWDPITSSLPGADGHAALLGLDRGNKLERKILRVKLADLANESVIENLGPPMPLEQWSTP